MTDKRLVIIGASSKVSQCLKELYERRGIVSTVGRGTVPPLFALDINNQVDFTSINTDADHYLINLGFLSGKNASEIADDEALASLRVNLMLPVQISEYILSNNKNSRIVILGSESGTKGSYDTYYFLAKAALNKYVEERQTTYASQTLNIVCPSMIKDGNMTVSRTDQDRVANSLAMNPRGKPLMARHVASLIYQIFLEKSGFLTNQVLGIDGGKFARMTNARK